MCQSRCEMNCHRAHCSPSCPPSMDGISSQRQTKDSPSAPAQRKRGDSHHCQPKGRASGRRSAHCAHGLPEPPPQLPGQGGDHTSTGTFSGSLLHDPHRHTGRPTDQSITPTSQMRKPRLSHGQQEWCRAGPSHNPRAPSSTLPSHFQRSLPQSGGDP